jgi:hypothetical protein
VRPGQAWPGQDRTPARRPFLAREKTPPDRPDLRPHNGLRQPIAKAYLRGRVAELSDPLTREARQLPRVRPACRHDAEAEVTPFGQKRDRSSTLRTPNLPVSGRPPQAVATRRSAVQLGKTRPLARARAVTGEGGHP